ncbi:molybdate ABC transporter substrate-binding protein [Pseudarthrobacter sp. J64]|uniref:molybdate ABC transporter substrate-binding protein n=1 Tax=Pseudarthrobacter sp. J64 TaxID=3116485 RepID=UPI002E81D5C1|nr:molybdate ABC transporter substrate-binding protein [Pseudarthrobacter sp. J64]MEE2568764.1 molybdate ABC transporter substrate-binding protein [Pseudarthrobacter sp. J64]
MKSRARRTMAAAVFLVALLCAALTGCGAGGSQVPPSGINNDGAAAPSGSLTVFAAASLKGTFTELAERFEAEHPGVEVRFSFAGSSDLASQISQGAPADVFAAADTRTMERLRDAGLVEGGPRTFATNTLAIAVPPGNPAGIGSFADLARPGLKLVACAGQVPCGAATEKLEQQTGTSLAPVSEENSVTDVLGKVISGEADAGLVYATDVRSAGGKVQGIDFPESAGAVNSYPIAAVKGAANPAAAAAFLQLVAGPDGQQILASAGFGPPDA